MSTATIVGSGPNGLTAAALLLPAAERADDGAGAGADVGEPWCRTIACTPSGTAWAAPGCRSPSRRWPGTGTSGWPV